MSSDHCELQKAKTICRRHIPLKVEWSREGERGCDNLHLNISILINYNSDNGRLHTSPIECYVLGILLSVLSLLINQSQQKLCEVGSIPVYEETEAQQFK